MKKILIIDDADFILESTSTLLEFEGYKVFTAPDGEIGIKQARDISPDMIICDISMPNLDGYGVLDFVRRNKHMSSIPFIFLTAFTEKINMRMGMEKGADDYIVKPFTREELINSINAQWNKHKMIEDRVQKKVEDIGKNVTYALPHEFRTALNEVIGSAKFLNSSSETISITEIKEIAADIIESSNRLLKITENFLIFVNIQAFDNDPIKRMQLRTYHTEEPVSLLRDIANGISKHFGREKDLFIDEGLNNTVIEISAESFSKLINELIDNAFRFSTNQQKVMVNIDQDDDYLRIKIIDEGRGMTDEQIRNIAVLTQFDRAVYEQQGVGIGLIVAKRLCEVHDGSFEISKNKPQGVFVSIKLPLMKKK